MDEILLVNDIRKRYRRMERPVLDGLSFSAAPGSIVGIIGPNGAGKTTLMSCLLGLLHLDSGEIRIMGRSPQDPEIRRYFAYVPERLTFDRWMRAYDFVAFHHALCGLPASTRDNDVAAALERVELPPAAWHRGIKTYSRGMLQRLGLAQAMLGDPRFIFLDEPTSGMDPEGVILFKAIVREKASRGAVVILNSHQLAQVEELCTQVCFLSQGKIATTQSGQQIREGGDFVLRWLPNHSSVDEALLQRLALDADCKFLSWDGAAGQARFAAENDVKRSKLIQAAFEGELALVEARAESKSLETLFEEVKSRTPR